MSFHYGFLDSDDESANTVDYACSDLDHYDKGVCCDGEHSYSREYVQFRTHFSESLDKSEVTVEKPKVIKEPKVEYDAPSSPLSSDPVQVSPVVAPNPSIDDSDDDIEADSEDACSRT